MDTILKSLELIEKQVRGFNIPWVTQVSKRQDPYQVLISCLLSLRTKDKTTAEATQRLFKVADTPRQMIKLPYGYLKRLIYPVGFYRNKAKFILGISRKIIEDFGERVPERLEDLLKLKGVGRKTANLVLGLGYQIPAICVDTHVHRIPNRLGWISTKSPQDTEESLKEIIPKRCWIKLNTLLVAFGQNICLPVSPYCSKCSVNLARDSNGGWGKKTNKYCKRIGVTRFR